MTHEHTRAAPPATTAGGGDVDSLNWVLSNDGWDTLPHAMTRKAIGVEELNAARIAIRHLRLGLAYHTRALESARPVHPVDEIVRETMRVFRDEWQCRIIDTDNLDEVCASIGIALRTALSVRTAGEKALSYEEIVKAYVDGASERCPLPLSPTELMSWEECGLHAVHALVAQRGVR